MSDASTVRRLTAIMFTDVVGYSTLMAGDERRALELLRRQRELFMPQIAAHHGTLHVSKESEYLDAVDAVQALCPLDGFEVSCAIAPTDPWLHCGN